MNIHMPRPKRIALGLLAIALLSPLVALLVSARADFLVGGALVNLGYMLQSPIDSFDLEHHDEITPEEIWREFSAHNELAASVRSRFPHPRHHPLVALLVCMDARLDTNELTGDTRKYYYTVRTAGSVLEEKEEEMLELAVEHGVRLIVLTTHTDCAAERAAVDPVERARYPRLTQAVFDRSRREAEFLARPAIARRIAEGKLLVKRVLVDTATERICERP
jgi:hypothetical protein